MFYEWVKKTAVIRGIVIIMVGGNHGELGGNQRPSLGCYVLPLDIGPKDSMKYLFSQAKHKSDQ